jgi:hypothetical protein
MQIVDFRQQIHDTSCMSEEHPCFRSIQQTFNTGTFLFVSVSLFLLKNSCCRKFFSVCCDKFSRRFRAWFYGYIF